MAKKAPIRTCLSIDKTHMVKTPMGEKIMTALEQYDFVKHNDILILPMDVRLDNAVLPELPAFSHWLNQIGMVHNIQYIFINLNH